MWLSHIIVMEEKILISEGVCVCIYEGLKSPNSSLGRLQSFKTPRLVPKEWHQYSQFYLECIVQRYSGLNT